MTSPRGFQDNQAIACEAEKAKAAEEANQVELNKRMLEVQLTHTDSEKLALFPSLSIYPSEIAPGIMNQGQEWNKPEVIQDMCNLLHLCQTVDELSDLRRYTEAPAWVFKQAASQLSATKRQQIRQWVLQDNEARSMPND